MNDIATLVKMETDLMPYLEALADESESSVPWVVDVLLRSALIAHATRRQVFPSLRNAS